VARGSRQLTLTEEALRANTVPTLTIIGSEDGLFADAQALAACMAHHELHVIEGKNHVNTDGCPDFMETLKAFLAAHTPRAEKAPIN
jgi:pimeloyl-ACP methyl ester carboxylesterase